MALDHWGLAELVSDVKVVVSELVTNASRLNTAITLTLSATAEAVGIEVTDHSPEALEIPSGDLLYADSGRGLLLVRHLAKEWGVHWDDDVPGQPPKTVWALMSK